jgi:presenilin-like A22 family membrane protease
MSFFFFAFYGFLLLFNKTSTSFYNFLVFFALKVLSIGDRSCISLAWAIPVFIETLFFNSSFSVKPLQFCMADGGSFIAKLNVSTNFLGVVSQSSSVKIYELDSHS